VIFFAHGAQRVSGWFGGHGLSGLVKGPLSHRLLKKTHLRRWRAHALPAAYPAYASVGVSRAALHLDLFEQPGQRWLFSSLVGPIIVMLVAIAKVHGPHGFFLNMSQMPGKGHGIEFNLALIGMALAVLAGGAGTVSIDRLIAPW
jgi:putative oxidoreductase